MTISKADERWLACLDRALAIAAQKAYGVGSFDHRIDEDDAIVIAEKFYAELPSNKRRRVEGVLMDEVPEVPHRGDDYEGTHAWGPWSDPYKAYTWWQARKCQCGNKDWRPAPAVTGVEGWM